MLARSEWQQYIHFDPHRYTRNLLALTNHFSLLLLCWSPNQRTYANTKRAIATQHVFLLTHLLTCSVLPPL
jgi:hypothetical protein